MGDYEWSTASDDVRRDGYAFTPSGSTKPRTASSAGVVYSSHYAATSTTVITGTLRATSARPYLRSSRPRRSLNHDGTLAGKVALLVWFPLWVFTLGHYGKPLFREG